MADRIDISSNFYKQERKEERASRRKKFWNWCTEHWDIALGGLAAGMGLVTTGIKVGGRAYRQHLEHKDKDLRCYDASLGRYWELKRKLSNHDWLEIDRRKARGERLGDILDDLRALK